MMGANNKLRVVFDSPSLLALIAKYRILRNAKLVTIYHDSSFSHMQKIRIIKKLRLHRLFNPTVEIVGVKSPMWWRYNPDVVSFLDASESKINPVLVERITGLLSGDKNATVKIIKKLLFNKIALKIFVRNQVAIEDKDRCVIITDENIFNVYDSFKHVSSGVWLLNYLSRVTILLLAMPYVLFRLIQKHKIALQREKMAAAELFVQVNHYGYADEVAKDYSVLNYVYDKAKVALLLLEVWRPADERVVDGFKAKLEQHGVTYYDKRDFVVTVSELLSYIKLMIKEVVFAIGHCKATHEAAIYPLFVKDLLSESVIMSNCNGRAMLCFDDYGWDHIIRTFLGRKKGMLILGVQHSSGNGLYGAPQLAYVCFDKYFIFGEFYKHLFARYWDGLDLVPLGYTRLDSFIKEWLDSGSTLPAIKNVRVNNGKQNILITLPSVIDNMEFDRYFPNSHGMIDFLQNVDESVLSAVNIYIRPKYKYGIQFLKDLIDNPSINFIDDLSITMAELITQVDMVVASNGSAVIAECAMFKRKVITYDYLGWLKPNWIKYGSQTCIQSRRDLEKVLAAFVADERIDVDWHCLWNDMVYQNASCANEVIKSIINSETS